MQVLFLQDVRSVARKGEIKTVKPGYFQNFLAPQKLAIMASGSMVKQAEKMREQAVVRKERLSEEAESIKKKLEGMTFTMTRKADGEKLYGSVAEKDLIEAVLSDAKVELTKQDVKMKEHIKTTGMHDVKIHLAEGVEATIKVDIQGGK